MASAPRPEQRAADYIAIMGGMNGLTQAMNDLAKPTVQANPQKEDIDASPDSPKDFWKFPDALAEEREEENPESLKLQQEFLNEKGYNWWSPPPEKIMLKRYRPSPNKPATKSLTLADLQLTLDARCGEPALRDIKFTPFAGICKFPYKFVSQEWRQPLATAIFDGDKIYNRDWDLYYVYADIECPRPCLFVPKSQFEALLAEINESFQDAHITVPQRLRDEGLVIDFSEIEDANLRPRWLGHSVSRIQADRWPEKLEQTTTQHETMPSSKDVELFKQKMDQAYEIGRNKKKGAKKAKQEQAVVRRQGMAKELVRAQKYLGLLPADEESLLPNLASLSIPALDPSKPAPYLAMNEPIFIAIDVEAYEREPKPITEVGVATLDTRDLKNVAPGAHGVGWQGAIRARHFRIAEYKHLVNKDFVQGCPEHFEFGKSETIGTDNIGSNLTSCFHAPFSSDYLVDPTRFRDKIDTQASTSSEGGERRNIIFLGHDVDNDIAYLRRLGFDPLNRGNLLETMDTRSMYQAYTHDPNPTSLGRILAAFDQRGWHSHNAGNDAVYTVWALLAMSVTAAAERGSTEAVQKRAEEMERREKVAVEEARERVREGAEGGVDGEGEETEEGGEKAGAKAGGEDKGFVPWQGSETGFYTENGYPLNI